MSFVLNVKKTECCVKVDKERRVTCPITVDEENGYIMVGDVFGKTAQELMHCGWEEAPEKISRFKTAVCLISYKNGKCVLCSDIMAMETVYYFHDKENGCFIVADDFWELVKEVKPAFEMLDIENTKLRLVCGGALLNGETLIKGIKYVLPGEHIEFGGERNSVEIVQYQFFKFDGKVTDVGTAVSVLGDALDEAMKDIKEKHGDVTYGIGLSGGLDSRLMLHYALKNNMKVVCFNVCKKRPHGLLKARSVRMAERIARECGVPLHIVEWKKDMLAESKEKKLRKYPDGPYMEAATDIFKYATSGVPEFDVLICGGGGGQVLLCLPVIFHILKQMMVRASRCQSL